MGFFVNMNGQMNTAPEPTLESPYNSMYVHLYYLQKDTYEPQIAAKAMIPGLDTTKAIRRSIQLKQIYDGMGLFVSLNQLPQNPDFLDSLSQKHYYTPFPKELPSIYLEKVGNKWYYSSESMGIIPGIHKQVYPLGADFLINLLPGRSGVIVLGLEIWQWLGILLILVLSYFAYLIMIAILRPIIKLIKNKHLQFNLLKPEVRKKIARYISLVLIAMFARMLLPALQLPTKLTEMLNLTITIFIVLFAMLLGLLLVRIFSDRGREAALLTVSKMDEQVIPIVTRILQIAVVLAAIITILDKLNVNVTALIAGLSIGGLALALAAQDTVKNLIGSVMIFIDKPFQVDDYIVGGDFEGSVTEVGFRTTRIRSIDTSIISVPNGNLANMSIKNLGVRTFRLFNTVLTVTYSTSPDKLRSFVAELKSMILRRPLVNNENYYVHFQTLNNSSLDVMFRCYLIVPDYASELALKEEILLEILEIAEKLEINFAFPSQTLYFEDGKNPFKPIA